MYLAEQIKKPLENYKSIDVFKVFISDVGLLCAKKGISFNDIMYENEEINDFKGGLAENYVNSQLIMSGHRTYFWHTARNAEVDFVTMINDNIIPIEVKSADNTKAKSLNVYIKSFKPEYSIKISKKNFSFDDGKKLYRYMPYSV